MKTGEVTAGKTLAESRKTMKNATWGRYAWNASIQEAGGRMSVN